MDVDLRRWNYYIYYISLSINEVDKEKNIAEYDHFEDNWIVIHFI